MYKKTDVLAFLVRQRIKPAIIHVTRARLSLLEGDEFSESDLLHKVMGGDHRLANGFKDSHMAVEPSKQ